LCASTPLEHLDNVRRDIQCSVTGCCLRSRFPALASAGLFDRAVDDDVGTHGSLAEVHIVLPPKAEGFADAQTCPEDQINDVKQQRARVGAGPACALTVLNDMLPEQAQLVRTRSDDVFAWATIGGDGGDWVARDVAEANAEFHHLTEYGFGVPCLGGRVEVPSLVRKADVARRDLVDRAACEVFEYGSAEQSGVFGKSGPAEVARSNALGRSTLPLLGECLEPHSRSGVAIGELNQVD
jgi:hypothetical protein